MKGLVDTQDIDVTTVERKRWKHLIIGFLSLLLVASYFRLPYRSHTIRPDTSPFKWQSCSTDPHYFCGSLTLPLDYTNTTDPRTITIATTLYRQDPKRKSARTMVINPGGPGGSGTQMLWKRGKAFGEIYGGGEMDVLGFDPRGVNLSEPAISCFPNEVFRDRWSLMRFTWPEVAGDHAITDLDAMQEAVMIACRQKYGDIPRFLTTAFVARDVDAIREALGEDVLTGFMVSYGTGVGQTYAQMFPDRVGSLVLDGMEFVRDGRKPWTWASTSLDNVTDGFEVGFLGQCVRAGRSRCALATDQAIPTENLKAYNIAQKALSHRMHNLFDNLKIRPIPGVSSHGPGLVRFEHLVSWLYGTMYHPSGWHEGAKMLAELEKGNATLALEAIHSAEEFWGFQPGEKMFGRDSTELENMVLCGDSYDAPKESLNFWRNQQQIMHERSWIAGTSRWTAVVGCRHYNWTAAEVYRGDFDRDLANPILLISSPYDPATPLRNGRRLLAEMGDNARLVVH